MTTAIIPNQPVYSHDEMEKAFSAVEDSFHWKGEVNADVSFKDLGVTAAAIEYFTATPTFVVSTDYDNEVCTIHADGYWKGPAN